MFVSHERCDQELHHHAAVQPQLHLAGKCSQVQTDRMKQRRDWCGTRLAWRGEGQICCTRVGVSAEQVDRMWGMSSTMLEQSADRRQTPFLFFDQCLHRLSLLYPPEIILACTLAIDTFEGEEPAVFQIG